MVSIATTGRPQVIAPPMLFEFRALCWSVLGRIPMLEATLLVIAVGFLPHAEASVVVRGGVRHSAVRLLATFAPFASFASLASSAAFVMWGAVSFTVPFSRVFSARVFSARGSAAPPTRVCVVARGRMIHATGRSTFGTPQTFRKSWGGRTARHPDFLLVPCGGLGLC
jgi:hypothetical protein